MRTKQSNEGNGSRYWHPRAAPRKKPMEQHTDPYLRYVVEHERPMMDLFMQQPTILKQIFQDAKDQATHFVTRGHSKVRVVDESKMNKLIKEAIMSDFKKAPIDDYEVYSITAGRLRAIAATCQQAKFIIKKDYPELFVPEWEEVPGPEIRFFPKYENQILYVNIFHKISEKCKPISIGHLDSTGVFILHSDYKCASGVVLSKGPEGLRIFRKRASQ